jgi:cob(I)alamin adenosyltransferase
MIYKVAEKYPVDERITRFVNRLSDYFFVLARKEVNKNGKEVYWEK